MDNTNDSLLSPCIKNLSKLTNAPQINIEFENLCYDVVDSTLGKFQLQLISIIMNSNQQ